MPQAQLTANNGVVSEMGPRVGRCLRPHDRKIARLCRDDMGSLESERKKKCHCLVTPTIAPLFWLVSTKLEEHERGIFCLGRAENTCCCTSGFTNHSSKGLSLSLSVAAARVKKKVHNILSPKCVENLF